ncbi:hypothetical protein QBC42DRAFT_281264 [Cladorrhinum samala]|uniref:Uncharacterized protein n=1 Tax=Cladorrhinum samala TaxID=585594 RepID=A0AAV9H7F7_9PEZI|nr:hypothetical protein QBC42DRAFT_281264 [Cladorrhinum samala]
MDLYKLVFCHCELGLGDIIVEPSIKPIEIIDWALAGHVPKAWGEPSCDLLGIATGIGKDVTRVMVFWQKLVEEKASKLGSGVMRMPQAHCTLPKLAKKCRV